MKVLHAFHPGIQGLGCRDGHRNVADDWTLSQPLASSAIVKKRVAPQERIHLDELRSISPLFVHESASVLRRAYGNIPWPHGPNWSSANAQVSAGSFTFPHLWEPQVEF